MSAEFKIKKQTNQITSPIIKSLQKSKDVEMVLRLKTIIVYATGLPTSKIAVYLDVSEKTIQIWIKTYNSKGIEGLVVQERPGRPPKLNEDQLQQVYDSIKADEERVWSAIHFLY